MPSGGKRPGAGRKKKALSEVTKRRKQIREEAMATGITPLEMSLRLMRHLWNEAVAGGDRIVNLGKAMQAHIISKDVSPYIHPKLNAVALDAKVDADVTIKHTADELSAAIASKLAGIAATGSPGTVPQKPNA